MLTAPQLILTAHLLNFNWRDLTIGDCLDWAFQILDCGFIKMVAHPPSNLFWKSLAIIQIEINPRHRPHHLSLLPSGPDEVHDRLLRGVQSKWPEGPKCKTLGREFSPA